MARECPNKRVMITLADRGVDSASDSEDMPDLVDANDDIQEDEYEHGVEVVVTHATEGKVMNLVTQRALNTQMKIDEVEQQRENIFHTRCLIRDNLCSMIIDGGSCTNILDLISCSG